MLKFLETYNLPKLNQEEAIRLNRLIIASKIEGVIKKKKSLHTTALDWTVSQENFTKYVRNK